MTATFFAPPQPCPTTHFCEQPSPLPTFTSSRLPPSPGNSPSPKRAPCPCYVSGEEGSRQQLVPGDSWLRLGRRHHHCYLSLPQPSRWPNPGWPHKWGAQGALRLLGQLSGLRQPFCLSGESRTRRASWGVQWLQRARELDHGDLACSFLEQKVGACLEANRPCVHYSGLVLEVLKRNVEVPHSRRLCL